jgi:hypothetical protein
MRKTRRKPNRKRPRRSRRRKSFRSRVRRTVKRKGEIKALEGVAKLATDIVIDV